MADTGLPGSPNASVPSFTPNQVGFPGRRLTPQKRSSTPSSRSVGFTWSCAPPPTAPESATTSDAHTARAAHHVGGVGRAGERGPRALGVVRNRDARHHLAARSLDLGGEGV